MVFTRRALIVTSTLGEMGRHSSVPRLTYSAAEVSVGYRRPSGEVVDSIKFFIAQSGGCFDGCSYLYKGRLPATLCNLKAFVRCTAMNELTRKLIGFFNMQKRW